MPVLSVDNLRNITGDNVPNQRALDNLQRVVDEAGYLCPLDGIMATAEGGAAAIWTRTNAYADIECCNDGSIHALLMRGREVVDSWEVTERCGTIMSNIRRAVERVCKHLYGATKSQCTGVRS